jgi:hypothetical protein
MPSVDPLVARSFLIYKERVQVNLGAEAFHALNHANFVEYKGTWGNGATPEQASDLFSMTVRLQRMTQTGAAVAVILINPGDRTWRFSS